MSGATFSCGAWASHCCDSPSCRRAQAAGHAGFSGRGSPARAQAQEMWQMGVVAPWRVGSRIRCQTPLSCIGRRFFTTEPRGSPPAQNFYSYFSIISLYKVSLLLTETVRWEVYLNFQANSHLVVVHPFPTYVKFHSCHKLNPYVCIWIGFWILKYLFRYLFILMQLYQCFVHHDFIVHLDIWDDLSPVHCFFSVCLFLFAFFTSECSLLFLSTLLFLRICFLWPWEPSS